MKKSIRLLALTLSLSMAVFSFAGCGNKTENVSSKEPSSTATTTTTPEKKAETNADREAVTIRFSQGNTGVDNPGKWADDPIKAAIEKDVNIKLEWDSGSEGYEDRIATELVAGTAPDVVSNYGQQELTAKWITDGVVTDIGAIINAQPDRYPILKKMINSSGFKMYNDMYAGDPAKTYAIYALTANKSWAGATVWNKALLAKAGFTEPPKTIEDFVKATTALGKQGISGWWPRNKGAAPLANFNEIDKTLFAPNGTTIMAPVGDPWQGFQPADKANLEGDWKMMTTSDETRDSLKVLAQMYKDGAVDKGLGSKDCFSTAIDEFVAGKIASCNYGFSSYGQYDWVVSEKWMKGNPNGSWEDLLLGETLKGKAGRGVTYGAPYWMGFNWFIPTSCKNPERVLDLIEFMATDKGQDYLFKGIEGVTYTKSGDAVTYNTEGWKKIDSIYTVEDGRWEYVWMPYLFAGGQDQLKLETSDDWYTASLQPEVVDSVMWTPDSPAKPYVKKIIDGYKDEAYVELPAYFTTIKYAEDVQASRKTMEELTLRYIPAMITGQMNIDKEWTNYVAEYEKAGAKALEAAFNSGKAEAKTKFDSYK